MCYVLCSHWHNTLLNFTLESRVYIHNKLFVQYKFFVDGEWRHDECQPYMNSDYGIVNTIFLAADPNYNVGPGMSSGPNMDVDSEAFQNVVSAKLLLAICRVALLVDMPLVLCWRFCANQESLIFFIAFIYSYNLYI